MLDRLAQRDVLGWSRVAVDSVSVRAKRRGALAGPSPTDRGKSGSKYHLLCGSRGAGSRTPPGSGGAAGSSSSRCPGCWTSAASRCATTAPSPRSPPCCRWRVHTTPDRRLDLRQHDLQLEDLHLHRHTRRGHALDAVSPPSRAGLWPPLLKRRLNRQLATAASVSSADEQMGLVICASRRRHFRRTEAAGRRPPACPRTT